MKSFIVSVAAAAFLVPAAASAGARCDAHPRNDWLPEADAKARIEQQGYRIDKFKVDGNCYEIYGTSADGKKVEIYFDTRSLAVVKMESK